MTTLLEKALKLISNLSPDKQDKIAKIILEEIENEELHSDPPITFRIPEQRIEEIAEEIDAGMICYVHKVTLEVESFPDELRGMEPDAEFWGDVMTKVEKDFD